MTVTTTVLPAYIDEAGSMGFIRKLTENKDGEVSLLCSLLFDPNNHAEAIAAFTPAYIKFRDAMPAGQGNKLHITDAFKPGNEEWAEVANVIRTEMFDLINQFRPKIIYAAKRSGIARTTFEMEQKMLNIAKNSRRSMVKISGENRESDERIIDLLLADLTIKLDAYAEDMALQEYEDVQVTFKFDDIDMIDKYEKLINSTSSLTSSTTQVSGYNTVTKQRVSGHVQFNAYSNSFRLNTQYIGDMHVTGKEHPLVLAIDIVTNHLWYHLKNLPEHSPLDAPESTESWILQEHVWGAQNGSLTDIL